jgi:hypothetical protein
MIEDEKPATKGERRENKRMKRTKMGVSRQSVSGHHPTPQPGHHPTPQPGDHPQEKRTDQNRVMFPYSSQESEGTICPIQN